MIRVFTRRNSMKKVDRKQAISLSAVLAISMVPALTVPTLAAESGGWGFAQCDEYINVRQSADGDGEVIGKLYNNGSVWIKDVTEDGWYHIESGNVDGYVSAEYIATGEDADAIGAKVAFTSAEVGAAVLNVRATADEDSHVVGTVYESDEIEVVQQGEDWVKVVIDDGATYGYVSTDYVYVTTAYPTAVTLQEDQDGYRSGSVKELGTYMAEIPAGSSGSSNASSEGTAAPVETGSDAGVGSDAPQAQAASVPSGEASSSESSSDGSGDVPDVYEEPSYSEASYSEDAYTEDIYVEDTYSEDTYTEDTYTEDTYAEDTYSEGTYTEDTYTGDTYTGDAYTGDSYTEVFPDSYEPSASDDAWQESYSDDTQWEDRSVNDSAPAYTEDYQQDASSDWTPDYQEAVSNDWAPASDEAPASQEQTYQEPAYDQSYEQTYDQSYDQSYDQTYDQSYDPAYDQAPPVQDSSYDEPSYDVPSWDAQQTYDDGSSYSGDTTSHDDGSASYGGDTTSYDDGSSYSGGDTTSYDDGSSYSGGDTTSYDDGSSSYDDGSSSSGTGQSVADFATQFVGNPYVWGGTSLTDGADCSGFVMSVYENYGVTRPHYAASQAQYGTEVSASDLEAGDLVFYSNGGEISHVGIYIGDNQIVHASDESTGIITSSMDYSTPVSYRRLVE
jgi:cell wall-associated NlpC family hydrolase